MVCLWAWVTDFGTGKADVYYGWDSIGAALAGNTVDQRKASGQRQMLYQLVVEGKYIILANKQQNANWYARPNRCVVNCKRGSTWLQGMQFSRTCSTQRLGSRACSAITCGVADMCNSQRAPAMPWS
jgi:hypothetical protein